jgi:hypothetical protein
VVLHGVGEQRRGLVGGAIVDDQDLEGLAKVCEGGFDALEEGGDGLLLVVAGDDQREVGRVGQL